MIKRTISQTPKILTMLGILFAMIFWDFYCDYREDLGENLAEKQAEITTPNYEFLENGIASHYGYGWNGRVTASGEKLDCDALQAAHRTLPFGTLVKVSALNNPENFVIVKIIDRGPNLAERVIDLTPAAFEKLAPLSQGVLEVKLETVLPAPNEKTEIEQIPAE